MKFDEMKKKSLTEEEIKVTIKNNLDEGKNNRNKRKRKR